MSCEDERPKAATPCDPCGSAVRNRYFRGKLLTVADYQAEQRYLIARRRLINRTMLGWGVAGGFDIAQTGPILSIGPGVAFDPHGREVVACERVAFERADDVVWLKQGKCGLEPGEPPRGDAPPTGQASQGKSYAASDPAGGDLVEHPADAEAALYLLSAHYAERLVGGVRVESGCGDEACEPNHVCETVVYSLQPVTDCPAGRPDCIAPAFPERACDGLAPQPDAAPAPDPEDSAKVADVGDRGTQVQLCRWSVERGAFDPCGKDRLCRFGGIAFDPGAGVPLACVRVGADDCGRPALTLAEACGPRRLARPNEVLFDLIRGCDLTRIQDVGWSEWLGLPCRPISFSDFAEMFIAPVGAAPAAKAKKGPRPQRPPVDTRFWVCFSGPVEVASLTPDVIAITLVQRDPNEDVGEVLRVPIRHLWIAPRTEGDPDGTTRGFRPMVSARFWSGEIDPDNTSGFEVRTLVEIEVRTGLIVDYLGQEVAGGGRFVPSRGTVPGGRFLSSFLVEPDSSAGGASGGAAAESGNTTQSA